MSDPVAPTARLTRQQIKSAARFCGKTVFSAADVFRPAFAGPRLLIYHQIDAGLGRQMEVTLDDFQHQLSWLQDAGRIVDLATAVSDRGTADSAELFVLTFDDGYEDTYRLAFPLLRERQIPFTLYLATDSIESGTPLTPGGRADPLTWDQINEMNESGLLTLGVHTHTHRDLRSAHADAVAEEFDTSDSLLVERTGVAARHFAYPWGYWGAEADKLVRTHYETAVLGGGEQLTADTDPLLLNRIPVQLSDSQRFFRAKVQRGARSEEWIRRRLAGYRGP